VNRTGLTPNGYESLSLACAFGPFFLSLSQSLEPLGFVPYTLRRNLLCIPFFDDAKMPTLSHKGTTANPMGPIIQKGLSPFFGTHDSLD
jgi:hypothetical protein